MSSGSHSTSLDLRAIQRPLKESYRKDPDAALVTLTARSSQSESALACSVDIGRAIYEAQAHTGVGGPGTAACSGDLLLGALAACAQVTCQMVAAGLGVPMNRIAVTVEGDLDLRGTLGLSKDVPVGFQDIRVSFELDTPEAMEEQLATLREKTEQYCVIMQTLILPPRIGVRWLSPADMDAKDATR